MIPENPSDPARRAQGQAAFAAGDFVAALALLRPFAEAGDAEAQAFVGTLLADSWHRLPRLDEAGDPPTADEWTRWEAEDTAEAIHWLSQASAQGMGPASHNLAMLMWSRPGPLSLDEARAQAKAFLLKAWEQGCDLYAFDRDDIPALVAARDRGRQERK